MRASQSLIYQNLYICLKNSNGKLNFDWTLNDPRDTFYRKKNGFLTKHLFYFVCVQYRKKWKIRFINSILKIGQFQLELNNVTKTSLYFALLQNQINSFALEYFFHIFHVIKFSIRKIFCSKRFDNSEVFSSFLLFFLITNLSIFSATETLCFETIEFYSSSLCIYHILFI